MARQTTWVLALLMSCAPVAAAGAPPATRRRPAGSAAPAASDAKDKDTKDQLRTPPQPDERERWKWWLYDRAELGITDQQSTAINQIFESTIPKLRETRQELDRAEEELSRTIKEHKADIAVVSGLLDRVESARSILQQDARPDALPDAPAAQRGPAHEAGSAAPRMAQERKDREPQPGFRRRFP